MKHSFLVRLLVLISVSSLAAFGSSVSYTFNGMQEPSGNPLGPSNFQGTTCSPSASGCIEGTAPLGPYGPGGTTAYLYEFDGPVTLSYSSSTGMWTLNYSVFTPYSGIEGFSSLAFGDPLISYNGTNYALAVGSALDPALGNDGYPTDTAGDLYVAKSGYQYPDSMDAYCDPSTCPYLTPGDLPGGFPGGRVDEPVWVDPNNMNVAGTGSLTYSCASSNGVVCTNYNGAALYTINDTFNAPTGFLSSGIFSIEISSYVCANGLIIGSVPEPRGLFLIIPVILLLGWCFKRHAALGKVS